jgi:hypothetical protein
VERPDASELSADAEVQLRSRDSVSKAWNLQYLEQVNNATVGEHQHELTITTSVVGWFSIAVAALAAPLPLALSLPSLEAQLGRTATIAWCFWFAGIILFIVSMGAAARVFWEFRLRVDNVKWITLSQFAEPDSLRFERTMELFTRIRETRSHIAIVREFRQTAAEFFFASAFLVLVADVTMVLAYWDSGTRRIETAWERTVTSEPEPSVAMETSSTRVAEDVLQEVARRTEYRVDVVGLCDPKDSLPSRTALAESRAHALATALVAAGVPRIRVYETWRDDCDPESVDEPSSPPSPAALIRVTTPQR